MKYRILRTILSVSIVSTQLAHAGPQEIPDVTPEPYVIRTENDLEAWLAYEPEDSPMRMLTSEDRSAFLKSLYFSEKGLASFSYAPLERLRPSELSRLLTLLGIPSSLDTVLMARQGLAADPALVTWPPPDHDSGIDYPGYICRSRGNCTRSEFDTICIGANC